MAACSFNPFGRQRIPNFESLGVSLLVTEKQSKVMPRVRCEGIGFERGSVSLFSLVRLPLPR